MATTATQMPQFSWQEARQQLKQGKLSRYLTAMLADEPVAAPVDPLEAGLAAHEAGQHAEALGLLAQALEGAPANRQAREAYARTLLALGYAAEAREELETLLKRDRTNVALHYTLGEVCLSLGDAVAAERQYRRVLGLDPQHTDAAIRIGILLFDAGRHEESIEALNLAVYLDRQAAVARYYLAQNCIALGDLKRALVQLHFLTHLTPDYGPSYLCLAAVFEALGDHRQVVTELENAIDLNFVDAEVMYRLGKAHAALGDLDAALAAFLGAVALDATHGRALIEAACICEARRHLDRARELYTALSQLPAYARPAAVALGRVETALRQIAGAIAGTDA